MNGQNKVQVLIADDETLVGEMIRGLLEELDYGVVGIANDGQQAVALTKKLRPDVVLMDIRMPGVDGITAAKCIQDICPTPIVMLTAYDTSDLVKQATDAGVGAYLTKPPKVREIERAITISLARFDDLTALRARNQELLAFAHTVAHDLKNPLTPVMSAAEFLHEEHDTITREELKTGIESIAWGAHKMDEVIKNLLLLAETNNNDIQLVPLDMAQITSEALRRVQWMIEKYHATIKQPDTWPMALGQSAWVEGIWANYISNAIKHGGPDPLVELGATPHELGMIRFWVRDNGPGIPPQKRPLLFNLFERLGQVRPGGHGLGLSIVRRITERLNGHVGVESEVGQGSTFYFALPSA